MTAPNAAMTLVPALLLLASPVGALVDVTAGVSRLDRYTTKLGLNPIDCSCALSYSTLFLAWSWQAMKATSQGPVTENCVEEKLSRTAVLELKIETGFLIFCEVLSDVTLAWHVSSPLMPTSVVFIVKTRPLPPRDRSRLPVEKKTSSIVGGIASPGSSCSTTTVPKLGKGGVKDLEKL